MKHHEITIIGAGQAGLQLSLGLQAAGWDVRLIDERSSEELRAGRVLSSQCMFNSALENERALSLDFWRSEAPQIKAVHFTLAQGALPPEKEMEWRGSLHHPAQSVDQRLKLGYWMEEFARRGGRLEHRRIGYKELEVLARESALVVVATGKSDLSNLFEVDGDKTSFHQPQRALALTYVHGMAAREEGNAVNFNAIPGIGEYFNFPALTLSGPCDIMVFEGIVGGPMDCWNDQWSAEEHLRQSLTILDRFVPWEAQRCRHVEITDPKGFMCGRFTPHVRKPIGRLESGSVVLGMADAVVLNDPIAGQGSNNASKCASIYLEAIKTRSGNAFDETWMQATFDRFWEECQFSTAWSNALLVPPPPHVGRLLEAAQNSAKIADELANGFDNPSRLMQMVNWFWAGMTDLSWRPVLRP